MQLDKIAISHEMVRADLLTVEYLGTPDACKLHTPLAAAKDAYRGDLFWQNANVIPTA